MANLLEMGRAFAALAAALAMSACTLIEPAPPSSPPPAPASARPADPPPLVETLGRLRPRPKPPLPATVANPAPTPPQAAPQAPVEPAALPPPEPSELTEAPPVVVGQSRAQLIAAYGAPADERAAPPARVLEFRAEGCVLSAYLYFDTMRNEFFALQYDVNGQTEPDENGRRCLQRISGNVAR